MLDKGFNLHSEGKRGLVTTVPWDNKVSSTLCNPILYHKNWLHEVKQFFEKSSLKKKKNCLIFFLFKSLLLYWIGDLKIVLKASSLLLDR